MYLMKTRSGSYQPYDTSDHEASQKIPIGSVVKASKSRNYLHLKKAFALIKIGFDSQDKYESEEVYRKVLTIRSGFFDEVEGKDGKTYYFPKSLAFDNMSQEEFDKVYSAILDTIAKDTQTGSDLLRSEVESFY
jgi:hypothetical protein